MDYGHFLTAVNNEIWTDALKHPGVNKWPCDRQMEAFKNSLGEYVYETHKEMVAAKLAAKKANKVYKPSGSIAIGRAVRNELFKPAVNSSKTKEVRQTDRASKSIKARQDKLNEARAGAKKPHTRSNGPPGGR